MVWKVFTNVLYGLLGWEREGPWELWNRGDYIRVDRSLIKKKRATIFTHRSAH